MSINMAHLCKELIKYGELDYYPFHMPGHKRNLCEITNPYKLDITEIDGFDNLHHPEGIIKDSMERAARVFGSDETYFLINGSTVGILSAIFATTKNGDTIIAARNSHKSIYHGIYLRELKVFYSYPHNSQKIDLNCGINPDNINKMLTTHPNISTVIVTSPTYEGIVSDIKRIAEIVHTHNAILIVDEAHGAHFGFHQYFPDSSMQAGADIVIQSAHKTLPAFTQSALIHLSGDRVNRPQIRKYLGIFQSSSPSYILMAGLDRCIDMLEHNSKELFNNYVTLLDNFRKRAATLKNITLITREIAGSNHIFNYDNSKIVLSVKGTNMTGKALYQELLTTYHLQLEMAAGDYVIAMTSIGDTEEGFERFITALKEIDKKIEPLHPPGDNSNPHHSLYFPGNNVPIVIDNQVVPAPMSISEADGASKRIVQLEDSIDLISGEYIYLYPPGIPIVVPGEIITKDIITYIQQCKDNGLSIQGLQDYHVQNIYVVT